MTPGERRHAHPPLRNFRQRNDERRLALLKTALTLLALCLGTLGALGVLAVPAGAAAYESSVGLGTASSYSVLAASTATNTGPSVLSGDLGVSPGSTDPGFTLATVHGATHLADAAAALAQSNLTTAYNDAAGRTPTGSSLGAALAGPRTLLPGAYNASSALGITGAITLDGQGNPNSVFVFQIGSALTTAPSTSIVLTGHAQACNVFWQVTSSATLDTANTFVGTIMALTSITVNTGTTIQGRALARTGAVTLDSDVFTSASCATTPTTTSVTGTTATTLTAKVTAAGGASAPTGGTVRFSANGVTIGSAPVGANGTATLTVPAGTVTGAVTAHFSGLISYGSSTSTPSRLNLGPVPVLPSTGTAHIAALTGGATATIALGIALLMVARRNRRAFG